MGLQTCEISISMSQICVIYLEPSPRITPEAIPRKNLNRARAHAYRYYILPDR